MEYTMEQRAALIIAECENSTSTSEPIIHYFRGLHKF